jgi:hypothetical protein
MPTLIEDLEGLAELYELAPQIRDRCRTHAKRLRGIFNDPRMVLAFEAPHIRDDVFARINGGTPIPPGGGR